VKTCFYEFYAQNERNFIFARNLLREKRLKKRDLRAKRGFRPFLHVKNVLGGLKSDGNYVQNG